MSKPSRTQKQNTLSDRFNVFARHSSHVAGSVWAFALAILVIVLWAVTGPFFGFSDTWQLVINTSTTIVTFIMVFVIQNTQNRDSRALHLKLDEVIRAARGARNEFVDLEEMTDGELKALAEEFAALHERERRAFRKHGHHLATDGAEVSEPETEKTRR